jgi:hypothetical protein
MHMDAVTRFNMTVRTAGFVLVALGVLVPTGWWLVSFVVTQRDNRRYGGPPMEDAFTPAARLMDGLLLLAVFAVLAAPGALLLLLAD